MGKVLIDIIEFNISNHPNSCPVYDMPTLYIVYRALKNDKMAQDLLAMFGAVIKDSEGHQVWPIVEE